MAALLGAIGVPQQEEETMKHLLLTTALCSLFAGTAIADETLKWRHVQHTGSLQTEQVGDVAGHALNVYRLPGIAFFPDGTIGSTLVIGMSDITNNSGPVNGYYTVNFPDGSALWLKYTGTVAADGKSFPRKGTSIVIGGKGRYAGAKGEGTFEGDGTPAITPTTINYIDNTIILVSDEAAAAKAMLTKAVAAIKADREVALGHFNKGEDGFRQGDLYPFCSRLSDGKNVAGPVYAPVGMDARTLKDSTGKAYGQEMLDGAANRKDGEIFEVTYRAPKPGTTAPEYPKSSYITKVGDLYCGVGYYK
jgi:hypothetical protein